MLITELRAFEDCNNYIHDFGLQTIRPKTGDIDTIYIDHRTNQELIKNYVKSYADHDDKNKDPTESKIFKKEPPCIAIKENGQCYFIKAHAINMDDIKMNNTSSQAQKVIEVSLADIIEVAANDAAEEGTVIFNNDDYDDNYDDYNYNYNEIPIDELKDAVDNSLYNESNPNRIIPYRLELLSAIPENAIPQIPNGQILSTKTSVVQTLTQIKTKDTTMITQSFDKIYLPDITDFNEDLLEAARCSDLDKDLPLKYSIPNETIERIHKNAINIQSPTDPNNRYPQKKQIISKSDCIPLDHYTSVQNEWISAVYENTHMSSAERTDIELFYDAERRSEALQSKKGTIIYCDNHTNDPILDPELMANLSDEKYKPINISTKTIAMPYAIQESIPEKSDYLKQIEQIQTNMYIDTEIDASPEITQKEQYYNTTPAQKAQYKEYERRIQTLKEYVKSNTIAIDDPDKITMPEPISDEKLKAI